MDVDWRHRAAYIQRHGVTVEEANEALVDPARIVADPDPKSRSGRGARVIGFSAVAGTVLVVIVVRREGSGDSWWGANAWPANSTDRRQYVEHNVEKEQ